MKKLLRLTAILSLLVTGAMAIGSTANVASADDVVGHVYVNNNAAGTNTITGWDRHSDGTLTPMPGNAFPTGGAGTGGRMGSQGALQLTADGRFVLAVNTASNSISVLRVMGDGSLTLVGQPVSSGGRTPLSIAVSRGLVYVANAGAGGSSYSGFRLSNDGVLTPIAGSTYSLPDGSNPGDVLFNSNGTVLVGVRVGPDAGPSYIDSFRVGSDGMITPGPASPLMAQRIGPFGSTFSPVNPSLLFVSNAHDGPGAASVSVYNVDADARLTPVAGSPFANMQTAACWVEISADGRFLYVVNTASVSISSYSIASDGRLTLIGNTPLHAPTGLSPFDARLDPSGRFLYVVGNAKVSAFAVNGGSLTELTSTPYLNYAGGASFGLVVN